MPLNECSLDMRKIKEKTGPSKVIDDYYSFGMFKMEQRVLDAIDEYNEHYKNGRYLEAMAALNKIDSVDDDDSDSTNEKV